MKIKDFYFDDLPFIRELDYDLLENTVKNGDYNNVEEFRNRLLELVKFEGDFEEQIDFFGDCNLRLETPLYLSLQGDYSQLNGGIVIDLYALFLF